MNQQKACTFLIRLSLFVFRYTDAFFHRNEFPQKWVNVSIRKRTAPVPEHI